MLEALGKNEAFSYKKLTPEEMSSRGILGRLVGPCADFTAPTRNGRKYIEALWENVFNDEIVKEKIAHKCLFGELGHPVDREEVDPTKIAIALNEEPKKNQNGQLIACFDILDTPAGKILKTLCDYGTAIGISSRGSGDIVCDENGEDIVDPTTYYFECFDAVTLPAVKSARLTYMTEDIDQRSNKLKKALKESYDAASDTDKAIMKDTLNNLNISLDVDDLPEEDDNSDLLGYDIDGNPVRDSDIEEVEDESAEDILIEEQETEETAVEPDETSEDNVFTTEADESEPVDNGANRIEDEMLVQDLLDNLSDFDKAKQVEFAPTVIDNKTYVPTSVDFVESADKLLINLNFSEADSVDSETAATEDDIETNDTDIAITDTVADTDGREANNAASAVDDGEDEVLESLKEAIRKNVELSREIRDLKRDKTVCDAKVESLEKSVTKYKESFARTSVLAAEGAKLKNKVEALAEQLKTVNKDNEVLTEKLDKASNLVNSYRSKEKELLEARANSSKIVSRFEEQEASYKKQLLESKKALSSCKAKLAAVLNGYLESKASLLGVNVAEITSKLNESYTLADIDAVCDKLLESGSNFNRLPFNGRNKNSSLTETVKQDKARVDDDLKDLYELAGLTL